MFDFFRNNTKPIIMIALIGFLATIIFAWGMDINGRQKFDKANLAAVINGEDVSWADYSRVYDNLIKAEQQNSDVEISDEKKNELYNTAWSQIRYERLILQEVDKYDLVVSDDELYDYLKFSPPQEFIQSPTFQTNGQFDYQKYMNALADESYASFWAGSEVYFKTELKKLKLQELIIQAAHITENEVKEYFISQNEKIKLGMINVSYAAYTRVDFTAPNEEALAFYESHQDNYKVEDRASLKVVTIEKKPTLFDWNNAEVQIKQLSDTIASGADFAELAKVFSDDKSAASGGDLGLFPQGQMVPEFDKMVFSMKDGDVSPPVKTQYGWHIIKHFGYTIEDNVKKAKVSHILIKPITSQESLDNASEKLQNFKADAIKLGFDNAAAKYNLIPKQTAPFENGANMQFLGRDVSAEEFAFTSELNSISEVFENSSVQFVVQLVEKLPAGVASFDICEKRVQLDIRVEKIKKMCADTAAVIWSEIEAGASFKNAAKNHNFEYSESNEFARGGYVPPISSAPKALGAAFALQNIDDTSGPVDYNQGTIIMKLLKKTPLDLNSFTSQKDSLSNIILTNKQQELFARWFDNLIENSVIVNNIQSIRAANRNF